MHHEPRGLVRDAKHAMDLVRRDAFLARIEQVNCQPPFRQRNLATLEHRSNSHGELALAFVAVVQAGTM
jgi:hypothetical protein